MIENRDASRSTVITSQLPRDDWHAFLGDPTVADAVIDRLVNNARVASLRSPWRGTSDHDEVERVITMGWND